MPRLLWFALGAVTGLAYASQLINKERLNLPPGPESLELPQAEDETPKQPFKYKLADTLDERADWLANQIDARVMALTDRLHVTGHRLAAKLRGEPTGQLTAPGVLGAVTLYGEPFGEPFETESADQADTGFEASR
jgi:hypothetical protein